MAPLSCFVQGGNGATELRCFVLAFDYLALAFTCSRFLFACADQHQHSNHGLWWY